MSVYLLVRVIYWAANLPLFFEGDVPGFGGLFWASVASAVVLTGLAVCLWTFADKFGGKGTGAPAGGAVGPFEIKRVALLVLGIYFAVAGFSVFLNDLGVASLAKQVPEHLRVGRSIPFAGDGFQAIAGIVICAISRAKKPLR